MVIVQPNPQDGWLQSDSTVLISALAAITVATSSVLLWRCQRPIPLQKTAHALAPSTLRTSLTSPRLSGFFNSMSDDIRIEAVPEEVPRDLIQQSSKQSTNGKTSRSKERRRRGKDPFKEFSKGGKRYKGLLRQSNRPSTMSNGVSTTPASEQDRPQQGTFPSGTDDSPSVQTSISSRLDQYASNQFPIVNSPPTPSSNSLQGETANPLSADKSDSVADAIEELEDECRSPQPTKVVLSDTNPESGDPNPSSLDESSQASLGHCTAPSWGSSSLTDTCSTSNTSSSRKSQRKSHSRVTSCPWDWDGQSSFYHDPPPRFARARAINPQRGSDSPIYSPLTLSPPGIPSSVSGILSTSSIESSVRCDAASPAPATRVSARTPPISRLPLTAPLISVSAQTQIASLRGALEAARLREEKSRAEVERRAKDYDALSWRWAEERTRWHRREAELHAQIQHLTLALQMYAGLTPFSSATVPTFPAFVSSSLSHAVPSTMSHHLSSPAFDSTRGRRRKRVQDDGEGNGDSHSDMFPFNDKVAGAILKRPESLRAETQRSLTPPNEVGPLRFPSLSDLGNVWPVREGEAEPSSRGHRCNTSTQVCEDSNEAEGAIDIEAEKTCDEKTFTWTLVGTDNTRDQTHHEELG